MSGKAEEELTLKAQTKQTKTGNEYSVAKIYLCNHKRLSLNLFIHIFTLTHSCWLLSYSADTHVNRADPVRQLRESNGEH